MFLNEPEIDAAVEAAYAASEQDAGHVMNYAHAWAWRQDVANAFFRRASWPPGRPRSRPPRSPL